MLGAYLLFSCMVLSEPAKCAEMPGSVIRPAGIDLRPHITCANVSVTEGNAIFTVAFAPGTFNPARTKVNFGLDTDRNPGTGSPGMNSSGTRDAGLIGVDYNLQFGSEFYGAAAVVSKFLGPEINAWKDIGQERVTYYEDGLQATVPLALIGGGSGLMSYKVVAQTFLGVPAFTQIQDEAPDRGAPAAVSVVH